MDTVWQLNYVSTELGSTPIQRNEIFRSFECANNALVSFALKTITENNYIVDKNTFKIYRKGTRGIRPLTLTIGLKTAKQSELVSNFYHFMNNILERETYFSIKEKIAYSLLDIFKKISIDTNSVIATVGYERQSDIIVYDDIQNDTDTVVEFLDSNFTLSYQDICNAKSEDNCWIFGNKKLHIEIKY